MVAVDGPEGGGGERVMGEVAEEEPALARPFSMAVSEGIPLELGGDDMVRRRRRLLLLLLPGHRARNLPFTPRNVPVFV